MLTLWKTPIDEKEGGIFRLTRESIVRMLEMLCADIDELEARLASQNHLGGNASNVSASSESNESSAVVASVRRSDSVEDAASDEEIEGTALAFMGHAGQTSEVWRRGFVDGAKWMRKRAAKKRHCG